jgi:molecular chaperone DnaJ
MAGSGEAGPAGGPSGDLYFEVKVRHDEVYSRDNDDLLCTLEIQMTDAILGTTTSFTGLDGDITFEIKPGTQGAEVITVKDRGITHLRGSGRGDLKVGIHVVTPVKLSGKERDLIESFAKGRKASPPRLSEFQQGMFSKLRDRFFNA